MSTLSYHFPEFAVGAVRARVFVRSRGDDIAGPAGNPSLVWPSKAEFGGLLTAVTR